MWEPVEGARGGRSETRALVGALVLCAAALALLLRYGPRLFGSLWCVLVVAGVAAGCSSDSRPSPVASSCSTQAAAPGVGARPAGRYVTSPRGVRVWAPEWLSGSLLDEALAEVDSTAPEADPRLTSPEAGVPVGVEVVVMDPGKFSSTASPTGLARGQTDMGAYVVVAFRFAPHEDRPLLPALAHELRHYRTRDAQAGH